MRRKLAAGNWKMNGLAGSIAELEALIGGVGSDPGCDVLICPPVTLITRFVERASGSPIAIGGQDCHAEVSGAHTGDVSAEMLKDAGATHVILGHSERRSDHGEDSATVNAKTSAAWRAGLTAIVCIGESEAERDTGQTLAIVGEQLARSLPDGASSSNTVIAYEPLWAIGTGRTPSGEDIAIVHQAIRDMLEKRFGSEGSSIRILYGGSMNPGNAAEIMAIRNVDGGLVGGASLKAADFLQVIAAASS